MTFRGQLLKMPAQLAEPIQYYLNLSNDLLHINALIGKTIKIKHIGYQCVNCGSDEKLFRMGFCKKCFFESPYASESIIRPELSRAHLGEEERDLEVEKEIQLVPHIVYLAYTGDVKVGVTRAHQVPTRWIDQGATFALPIAKTNNRYEAGVIEVALKQYLTDKTNYKKMLEDDFEGEVDLATFRNEIEQHFPEELKQFYTLDGEIQKLDFPYQKPEKVSVFTLEKQPEFEGVLCGIKGQYLAFEGGNMMNVRSHEGYVIELSIN